MGFQNYNKYIRWIYEHEREWNMHERKMVGQELCKKQISNLYVVKTLKYTPRHGS